MIKKWYHEVDSEWLKARKSVITATEISKLVPEYKRTLKDKSGMISSGFAALWAEKMTDTEPDPSAVGAAARGHICEPWAVKAWNMQMNDNMYHWDDALIRRNGVGFSPDALNIPQTISSVVLNVQNRITATSDDAVVEDKILVAPDGTYIDAPVSLLEIKSYDPAHHMKCCIKDKLDQDEMMQIAVPFIVCPTIQKATLIFFCPGAPIEVKAFTYTREDLLDKIDLANKIIEKWEETCECCARSYLDAHNLQALCTEEEIYQDYLVSNMQDNSVDNVFLLRK